MIVPGRPILLAALVLAVLLVGALVMPALVYLCIALNILMVLVVLGEGWLLRRIPITVAPEWPTRVQIGRPVQLVVRVENRGRQRVLVTLRQLWPDSLTSPSDTAQTYLDPGEAVRLAWEVTPGKRGAIPASSADVEIRFSTDVARRRWNVPMAGLIVYPSLKGVANYERLRRHRAASQAGIHQMRVVGSGREFEQLRDYIPDDDYREINWKATARHSRPITTVYRAERSQDIMLCLDCGRMMGSPVGNATALEYAIDAAVMLAHVANRQADNIGLVTFRDVVARFIKPVGGMVGVNSIVETLMEAQPSGAFPSYSALVEVLRKRQKRRCIAFLFTDLNDPQLVANMAEILPLISRRHVLVAVNLRDPLVEKVASGPAENADGVYQVLAARELARERAQHTLSLMRSGVHVLEADADSLSLKLINSYLQLKARQLV